jgi:hypothetical protein
VEGHGSLGSLDAKGAGLEVRGPLGLNLDTSRGGAGTLRDTGPLDGRSPDARREGLEVVGPDRRGDA